jgi:uncharacterized MnhB-related membrane protein
MCVLKFKLTFNSLLYTKYVVAILMLLLTIVQLFVDGLFTILVTATLFSLVIVVVTSDLM